MAFARPPTSAHAGGGNGGVGGGSGAGHGSPHLHQQDSLPHPHQQSHSLTPPSGLGYYDAFPHMHVSPTPTLTTANAYTPMSTHAHMGSPNHTHPYAHHLLDNASHSEGGGGSGVGGGGGAVSRRHVATPMSGGGGGGGTVNGASRVGEDFPTDIHNIGHSTPTGNGGGGGNGGSGFGVGGIAESPSYMGGDVPSGHPHMQSHVGHPQRMHASGRVPSPLDFVKDSFMYVYTKILYDCFAILLIVCIAHYHPTLPPTIPVKQSLISGRPFRWGVLIHRHWIRSVPK